MGRSVENYPTSSAFIINIHCIDDWRKELYNYKTKDELINKTKEDEDGINI